MAGHVGKRTTSGCCSGSTGQTFIRTWPTSVKTVQGDRRPATEEDSLFHLSKPFSRIAMDIVGPLPKSSKEHKYILVICDYATRYPEAVPLWTCDAEAVAEELVKLFSRVGIPKEILTDQGTSQLLAELYRLLNIHSIWTTPYHPQTDGLVDHFNQTLKAMLQRTVTQEGKDWDRLLPYLLFAYHEVPQTSTGFSPFKLLNGRAVRSPLVLSRWPGKQMNGVMRVWYHMCYPFRRS